MSDTVIITAIVSGSIVSVFAVVAAWANIEEIARAARATFDWWKKRGDQ